MLKQLEVLKEEEKEFQNLKVSRGSPLSPNPQRWGQTPPVTLGRGAAPLPVPPTSQKQLIPHPALLLPGWLSLGHVPSGGPSQRAVPEQGEMLWDLPTVFWPQQLWGVT